METMVHEVVRETRETHHRPQVQKPKREQGGQRFAAESICVNCVHKQVCMHLSGASAPIQFCEEWELRGAEESQSAPEEPIVLAPAAYKGLCQTCDERTNCRLAHTSEGIWHCEHYR